MSTHSANVASKRSGSAAAALTFAHSGSAYQPTTGLEVVRRLDFFIAALLTILLLCQSCQSKRYKLHVRLKEVGLGTSHHRHTQRDATEVRSERAEEANWVRA